MAEGKRIGLGPQLDMGQLMLEAQNRWLRPVEICEILKNHRMFPIQSEPPNRPPGGSFFLFDRRVLRYFRKDGHNWRKKKDGKTVKEAHEKLKDGSIDVLHCYYAHGEDDENLQRRSYWMLEEDLTHLVFVHYRNVKGSKASTSQAKDVQPSLCNGQDGNPFGLNSMPAYNQMLCMEGESPPSGQSSEYEDADADNHQASSRYNSFLEVPRDDLKHVADPSHLEPYIPVMLPAIPGDFPRPKNADSDFFALAQEDVIFYPDLGASTYMPSINSDLAWDTILRLPPVDFQSTSHMRPMFGSADNVNDRGDFFSDFPTDELTRNVQDGTECQSTRPGNGSLSTHDSGMDTSQNIPLRIGKSKTTSIIKQLSMEFPNLEGDAGLKKYDSFSRWMSKELEEVDGLQSSSGICWDEVENDSVVEDSCMSNQSPIDPYVLSPSLAQDQLFSIIEFSPCWGYAVSQTKVLVNGTFLTSKNDIETCQWSCMFGEVEVPAVVIADGTLECYAPQHRAGQVPFYVTCSNRLACSEVREFEYVIDPSQSMENSESNCGCTSEMLLHIRFEKMISLDRGLSNLISNGFGDQAPKCKQICSLLRDADGRWPSLLNHKNYDGTKDQKLLKEKLCSWLLHKIIEDEKGPGVLDVAGQSIIHLAAALDYDWAMEPIVASGVGINFRDVSGWTALHWAAYYGREKTVVALMYLGAAPGLLTDPTSEFPSGRTPADLASSEGHKGIAGFLAESSLTSHLSTLTFKESIQTDATNCTETSDGHANWNSVHFHEGEMQDDSSLKDSLSAVRIATQAAARIHMAFRVQSFHRKKMIEYDDDVSDLSDEHVLSRVAVKSNKSSRNVDIRHAAATKIQNKYRGWKGRQEFLVIRRRIINIQAHVRGYQVRKRKKLLWTFGIVQKALMWRRKSKLYHVQSETLVEGPSLSLPPPNEKDQDLLKEGRKQSEVRLEKALARVKSMVQYPEARDQYRRLRTGVEDFKSQATLESILTDPPDSIDMDVLDEIEELLGEDIEMPLD